ncbi:MAG: sugar phosphate isomerase/epimerase [Candidatus Omnitrophica bacterium]|nr:sugar phosphate isomerase/epimerase [Candidatus Omnitrophota bacterium]
MYFTGFADEAGTGIDVQIKATKELGWENIESRNIDGTNITNISDKEFDEVFEKLQAAGVKINCFGSEVANWGKDPVKEDDFQKSIEDLKRGLPRMHKLGCKMIRGMSFAIVKELIPYSVELEKTIFKKVNYLVKMCEDAGILYLHENCMNYGGMSYEHTLKLIDNVKSPNFKLVFDTGNPVFSYDRRGKTPYRKQDSFEFYSQVKEHIHYVHIKDGVYIEETDNIFPKSNFTFAGEGDGQVEKIIKDLLSKGYDNGFSMEPHLSVVFHDKSQESEDDIKYNNYIEYGKRFMALVEKIKSEL